MLVVLISAALLVAVTAFIDATASRLRMPPAILLVVVGGLISFVPWLPSVSLDPELILMLFLPPLIYTAGVGMSWRGFRKNLRPIVLLAVGGVLVTATAVAAVGHWLLGMTWAVGFVLGAVVSPPDPVAPMAISRHLKLPQRLLTILEGEGVVNDAMALILLSFAIGAVTLGDVSLAAASTKFVMIVAGELTWGWAAGWAMLRIRRWIGNPQLEIMLALLTPFLAFWPAHVLGGSGVLAALTAGLYVSWYGPRFIAPATRLQGYFVWGLIARTLEGLLFLLTGLQARAIVGGLDGPGWERLSVAAAAISTVVILIRFAWVFPASYVPRWLFASIRRAELAPAWQSPFLIGFTGIRGVVSLIAALSIPVAVGGTAFPERSLILFVAFSVIVVTLVGQGTVLPLVLKRLGLVAAGEAEAAEAKVLEVDARVAGVDAALAALDGLARQGAPAAAVALLRQRYEARRSGYRDTADVEIEISPVTEDANLQVRLIEAERQKISDYYAESRITDDARRRIERELDLEDARNRHALESATGDRLADPEAEAEAN